MRAPVTALRVAALHPGVSPSGKRERLLHESTHLASAYRGSRGIRGDGAPGPQIARAPTVTFVSPSGDLGVNVGFISVIENGTPRRGGPFMTIWRRTASGVWRYVAE